MTKLSSLEKRVKRRITARTHRFFAACPPGLKNLCYREIAALTEKLKFIKSTPDDLTGEIEPALFQDIEIIVGGVEFTSAVQGCYAANLYLRSPSKILMRIAHFKAENFRTLEKKLKEIEWELYLNPDLTFEVEVSAKSSRLYHTDAVANRGEKVIKDYFSKLSNSFGNLENPHDRKQSSNKKEGQIVSQTIMIRAEDDKFEISIDSSGELLHKRGLKENVGAAPIRETLAFAILSAMNYPFGSDKSKSFDSDQYPFGCNKSKSFNVDKKSDFDLTGLTEPPYLTKQLPLIDGMCGSGTFALEAAMIADNIPAGFFRHFAFESWPCFRAGQWNYIKKMAEADMPQSYKTAEPQEPFIFALDKNDKILKELERTVEIFNFGSSIKIMQGDFFDIVPERLISEQNGLDQESTPISEKSLLSDIKGFVVLNPPYGKRIGDKWESEKMFAKIGKKLESDFKGWRAGVVLPDRKFLHYLPGRKSLIPLFHGGLEIYAAIIQI